MFSHITEMFLAKKKGGGNEKYYGFFTVKTIKFSYTQTTVILAFLYISVLTFHTNTV